LGIIGKEEERRTVDELTPSHQCPQDSQQQQAGGDPPVGHLLRIRGRERMLKQEARDKE
jgi:hypothetical protein